MLADNQVELIEIPQRRGRVRKNAADIKMAVDAVELAFERDYVTAFVICTGDSDFTPLVQKLRELNKRVLGVGLKASTSAMLPPACDEFLFYENLGDVEIPKRKQKPKKSRKPEQTPISKPKASEDVAALITTTLAGLQRSTDGTVSSSSLKRAMLRKDPTFSEADHGFRGFGELLRHLASNSIVELSEEGSRGDPAVDFPKTDAEQRIRPIGNRRRQRRPTTVIRAQGSASKSCKATSTNGVSGTRVSCALSRQQAPEAW